MDWRSRVPVWDQLPEEVRRDLREVVLDFATTDAEVSQHYKDASSQEVLDIWLNFNGLIGFTDQLIRVIEGIQGASQ